MKLIGVKMKTDNGEITHSQIVRLDLLDCEHPFFSRVWHGVHILDESSQLLSYGARRQISENGGRWPKHWYNNPDKIRNKMDFHNLVSSSHFMLLHFIQLVVHFIIPIISIRSLPSVARVTFLPMQCMHINVTPLV